MNDFRIHQHYAKALFLLARDLNVTDSVMQDMTTVGRVCAENHILNKVMGNPTIREDKKRAIVSDIFAEHVSETSLAFLLFVVRRKRAVNLRGIAEAYQSVYREANGIVVARVRTAADLNDGLAARLQGEVERFTGKRVSLECETTDRMLGGFQLMFDTYLVDARLQTRIDRMHRAFSRNDYESKL